MLVLGTDPSPAKKARDWAASPVNLLNVAVSRARCRLFVIGSYDEWRAAPNFSVLAATPGNRKICHNVRWFPSDRREHGLSQGAYRETELVPESLRRAGRYGRISGWRGSRSRKDGDPLS